MDHDTPAPKKKAKKKPAAVRPLPRGQYREASADELPILTVEGWRVIAPVPFVEETFDDETIKGLIDVQRVVHLSTGTMAASLVPMMWKGLKKKSLTTRYLLWRDVTTAQAERLAELQEDLAQAHTKIGEAEKERRASERALSEAQKAVETAKAEVKRAQDDKAKAEDLWNTSARDLSNLKADYQRLKTFVGKVWRALGDVRMRELFGSDIENPDPPSLKEQVTAYDRLTGGSVEK